MTSGTASGGSGLAFVDCGMSAAVGSLPDGRRRGVAVNGRRIKTIDIHAHCAVPEALELMGHSLEGAHNRPDLDMATAVALRMKLMDQQAIDVEALSINPNWYAIQDRDLAADRTPGFEGRHASRVRGTTGVVPFGRVDGNRAPLPGSDAHMLIDGVKAPILGVSLEHTVLALSNVAHPEVGEDVVVVGSSNGARTALEDIARWQGVGVNDVLMSLNSRIPQMILES